MKKSKEYDESKDWPRYVKWTDGNHEALANVLHRLADAFAHEGMTVLHNDKEGDMKLAIKLMKQFQRSTDWDGT